MLTGLFLILMGFLILVYPRIIVRIIGMLFIGMGLSVMAVSWQFRRFRRKTQSPLMQWIVRW